MQRLFLEIVVCFRPSSFAATSVDGVCQKHLTAPTGVPAMRPAVFGCPRDAPPVEWESCTARTTRSSTERWRSPGLHKRIPSPFTLRLQMASSCIPVGHSVRCHSARSFQLHTRSFSHSHSFSGTAVGIVSTNRCGRLRQLRFGLLSLNPLGGLLRYHLARPR